MQRIPSCDQTGTPPFPLLDDLGIGLLDQGADPGEHLAAPVAELLDPRVDQLGGRGVLVRFFEGAFFLHVLPPSLKVRG